LSLDMLVWTQRLPVQPGTTASRQIELSDAFSEILMHAGAVAPLHSHLRALHEQSHLVVSPDMLTTLLSELVVLYGTPGRFAIVLPQYQHYIEADYRALVQFVEHARDNGEQVTISPAPSGWTVEP
jgi:hypothetical protein